MSVKARLLLVLCVSVLGFALIFAADRVSHRAIARMNALESHALDSYTQTMQARRQEKNFLLRKEEEWSAKTQEHMDAAEKHIQAIRSLDPESEAMCGRALKLLAVYRQSFIAVVEAQKAMGLKWDQGLQGEFVMAARVLEKALANPHDTAIGSMHDGKTVYLEKALENRYYNDILIVVLQMRRQEKNYLDRDEERPLKMVRDYVASIRRSIQGSGLPAGEMETQIKALGAYSDAFEALVRQRTEFKAANVAMIDSAREMEPAIIALSDYYQQRAQALSDRFALLTLLVELSAGAGIVLLCLWTLMAVTRPLRALQDFSRGVASGQLDAEPKGVTGSEFLALSANLSAMVGALKERMDDARRKGEEAAAQALRAEEAMHEAKRQETKVKELWRHMVDLAHKAEEFSDQLATAAEQLAAMVAQVKQGAFVQSERMAETATAVDQMNAAIIEVARGAASASESAHEVRGKARSGADMVYQAVESIGGVRDQALQMQGGMSTLNQQVGAIGQVMDVISEIADQTNLLALNAAIEAARAGDAGRGFAVVADEVRKLAEKSMAATKEVGERVKAIQDSARQSMERMVESVQAVEKSTELAKASGAFQEEILGLVELNSGQVEVIASASEEQSATSDQINRAVLEVNRIAEESAGGMATSHEAVQSLSGMAVSLRSMMREMLAMGNVAPADQAMVPPAAKAAAKPQSREH